jgi:hypothetical protein
MAWFDTADHPYVESTWNVDHCGRCGTSHYDHTGKMGAPDYAYLIAQFRGRQQVTHIKGQRDKDLHYEDDSHRDTPSGANGPRYLGFNAWNARLKTHRELHDGTVDADLEVARHVRQKKIDAEVADKLRLIEVHGEDTYRDGTVFKFSKKFVEGGDSYTYAVIKANGKWYTTGPKSPKGYDWDEFILWLVSGIPTFVLVPMVAS